MKKFLTRLFRILLRNFLVSLLPVNLQRKIAQLGFPNLCSKNKKIDYIGNVFRSDFKIQASTFSTIERVSTSYFIDKTEPALGMNKINFENFVCIDVGANIGSMSLFMIHLKAKKVIAFEPGPSYYKLCKNIALNKLDNKIIPINLGVNTESDKFVWEEVGNYHNGYLKSLGTRLPNKNEKNIVETINLDEYLEKIGEKVIDFIKYDIEGMELKAIMGSKETIRASKPILAVEVQEGSSKLFGYDCITPIFEYLYSLNYETYFCYKNKFVLFEYPEIKMNKNYQVLYKKQIPNFIGDVFFIHPEKKNLIKN